MGRGTGNILKTKDVLFNQKISPRRFQLKAD